MAYSAVGDLLLGSIPTPDYLDKQKFVDDAADEVDSKIGLVYQTPINVIDEPSNPVVRPVRLLLKRINNFLATGRLLLAVASPSEDDNVHAYGWSLIKEATSALDKISTGEISLTGVEQISGNERATTVLISNVDEESNVEAFYDRLANPNYIFPAYYNPPSQGLVS